MGESASAAESFESDLPAVRKPELGMHSSYEVLSCGLDDEDEVKSDSCRCSRLELSLASQQHSTPRLTH